MKTKYIEHSKGDSCRPLWYHDFKCFNRTPCSELGSPNSVLSSPYSNYRGINMHKIWKYILNIASGAFIIAGPLLNFLSKKYMGLSRSLAYRHDKYFDSVFAPHMLKSQLYVVLALTVIALIAHTKYKKGMYNPLRHVLFSAGILCGLNVIMTQNPPLWSPYVYIGIGLYLIKSLVVFYQSATIK